MDRPEDLHSQSGPAARNADYAGDNLVFIVGCPRSGTTWLQRLLACHPRVRTGQETHVFEVNVGPQLQAYRLLGDPGNRGGVGLACYFAEAEFLRNLKAYLLVLLEPVVGSLKPGELFVEKTPAHALFIPEILELLPRSRIIHVLRDPRDVVVSLMAASRSWGSWWAPGSARAAARMWVRYVRTVREASRNLPPWQFLEVKYEDLHRATIDSLSRCAEFSGLEWDQAAVVEAIEANSSARARGGSGGTPITLSGEAAARAGRIVVEPQGFIRRGQMGSWRTDLSVTDRYRVWRLVRKSMSELGYRWSFFLQNS